MTEKTEKRKTAALRTVKTVVFLLILGLLLGIATNVLKNPGDPRSYQNIGGFYDIPDNSLDAVYIGSSRVYAFWNAMFAWKEKGISVAAYSSSAQPLETARFLIEEARKTQPNALMIVNFDEVRAPKIERVCQAIDYMRLSPVKFRAVQRLGDKNSADLTQRASLLFPIIRYHSRWDSLTEYDFTKSQNGYYGASVYTAYLNAIDPYESFPEIPAEEMPVDEDNLSVLEELLDFCDSEKVNVLFVISPQAVVGERELKQRAASMRYIASRGYPALDMQLLTEEIGLDPQQDYCNSGHTNIHGSLKFTRYLADYLVAHYGFSDKRTDPAYAERNAAWKNYAEIVETHAVDFEFSPERDYSLGKPGDLTVTAAGEDGVVSWQPVKGAAGYAVYRKKTKTVPYACVGETEGTEFVLPGAKDKGTWLVVPYSEKDGVKYYGNFDYKGTEAGK